MIISDLIGLPFEYGARGPSSFDCYGLVIYCHKAIDGVDIPDYTTPKDNSQIALLMADKIGQHWERSSEGRMIYIRANGVSHVGFDLRNGTFIHAWEGSGVRIERESLWNSKIIAKYSYAS